MKPSNSKFTIWPVLTFDVYRGGTRILDGLPTRQDAQAAIDCLPDFHEGNRARVDYQEEDRDTYPGTVTEATGKVKAEPATIKKTAKGRLFWLEVVINPDSHEGDRQAVAVEVLKKNARVSLVLDTIARQQAVKHDKRRAKYIRNILLGGKK